MDGLSQAFSSIMSSSLTPKLVSGGLLGAGEIGNIIEEQKRVAYQNFVMNLLKNPQQLAAMAAKIQAPLSENLIQSVGNTVQGNMASRGLAQAPGIFAATESQALAPYEQQNQTAALNAVMASLGLPAGSFAQPANLGPLMNLFSSSFKVPTQTATSTGLTGLNIDQGLNFGTPND